MSPASFEVPNRISMGRRLSRNEPGMYYVQLLSRPEELTLTQAKCFNSSGSIRDCLDGIKAFSSHSLCSSGSIRYAV